MRCAQGGNATHGDVGVSFDGNRLNDSGNFGGTEGKLHTEKTWAVPWIMAMADDPTGHKKTPLRSERGLESVNSAAYFLAPGKDTEGASPEAGFEAGAEEVEAEPAGRSLLISLETSSVIS